MIKRLVIVFVLILALTSSSTLTTIGVVHSAVNTPLADVFVYADPSDSSSSGSSYAITDAAGQYNMTTGLTAGTYNVTAFAFGYIAQEIDLVNVIAGQTTMGINFDLQASGGISGMVTDAISGDPLNGTTLFAQFSDGTEFGWLSTSESDGSYLIATNLPSGQYNVSVFLPPDGYIGKMTTANVIAGLETKNINLQLARSGIISGTVTAPNDTALFGISVTAVSEDSSTLYFGTAETDLSGNYRINTGLGTANYTVYASGAGNYTAYGGLFTPTPVQVTAGQEKSGINMELTLVTTPPTPSGTISGYITDLSSNPIRLASVTASGSEGIGFAETDDTGYYSISSGLSTGNDYNVTVTASGYFDAYYPTSVSVTVGQITQNINIQMAAEPAVNFGTITGTVTGAPNPIIPEFSHPLIGLLPLALATLTIMKLVPKTRRFKNTTNQL